MIERAVYLVEEYNINIPLLVSENDTGFIHSLFANGFNIKMGEHLFFISSNKNGQLPFSMIVKEKDLHEILSNVTKGATVHWDWKKEKLILDDFIGISFERGTTFRNKLDSIPYSQNSLRATLEDLLIVMSENGKATGTNVDINDFMEWYVQDKLKSDQYKVYYELMESLYSLDKRYIENVLRYFLGRGKGTTPSGDDYMIGLLAIHARYGKWSEAFLEVLSSLIENESITTDISNEYLRYALKGEFGLPVIEVMKEMGNANAANFKNKIWNLLSIGHSSGLDTTFGMLIGLLAIRR